MPADRTHGYDIVFEMTAQAFHGMLFSRIANLGGSQSIDEEINVDIMESTVTVHVTGEVEYWVGTTDAPPGEVDPTEITVDFDPSIPNGIVIGMPILLNLANLQFEPSILETLAPDSTELRITIRCPLAVTESGLNQACIGLDLTNEYLYTISFDSGDGSIPPEILEELEANCTEGIRDAMATGGECLGQTISLDPTNPIMPNQVDLRLIGGDCLALLMRTCSCPDRTPDPDAFEVSEIPAGVESVLIFSNHTVLQHFVLPGMLQIWGLSETVDTYFENAGHESHLLAPVSLTHMTDRWNIESVTIEAMQVSVQEEGFVLVTYELAVDGKGFNATINGSYRLFFELVENEEGELVIQPRIEEEESNIDREIEWWMWLFIPLGLFVELITGIVLIAVYYGGARNAQEDLMEAFSPDNEIPPFPLPFNPDSLFLDDLTVGGDPIPPEPPEIKGPTLWLEGSVEVDEVTSASTHDVSICTNVSAMIITQEVSNRATYRAVTRRMLHPVHFSWYLEGYSLEGAGSTSIDGVPVRYEIDRHECQLQFEGGDSLQATLVVEAVDARGGPELSASEYLEIVGGRDSISVTGEELLMGPSFLDFLWQWSWSSVVDALIDLPDGNILTQELIATLPEAAASHQVLVNAVTQVMQTAQQCIVKMKEGRDVRNELHQGMQKGMGIDLPM